MAYRSGDRPKPIPRFTAPKGPRYPSRNPGFTDRGTDPTRPAVSNPKSLIPKPGLAPKSGGKGGSKGGAKLPAPDESTPYDAYIEELKKLKAEEIARQQKEADRIRQAYAAYAAYVKDLPDRVQALYSGAGHDQAQFANGFANGLRETAAAQAAEINAQLAKIGAPEGQQIAASQGEQAGNVLYGSGGQIPANALTTSGAAFGAAAAFMGPNAIKSGLLESQKYLTDNAGRISDFDMEIAKGVGEQSRYRDEAKAKKAADLKDDAADLYNNGLITQREFARRMGIKDWRRYPNAPKPGKAAGIDASASKLVGFLVDDDGNFIRDRKGNPIPIKADPKDVPRVRTQVVGSDATGRKLINMDTGEVIAVISNKVKPAKKDKAGGAVTCYNTSQGIICLDAQGYPVPGTGSMNPSGGADPDFQKNASKARSLASDAVKGQKVGTDPYSGKPIYQKFGSWQAALDWMVSKGADPNFAAWALWSKGGSRLKGAPKKRPTPPKANAVLSGGDYSGIPTGLTVSGFRPLAIQIANKYQIPVAIFLSLIQHESGWDPNITSPAGAVGLGQLMPGTSGVKNRRDPAANLDGSARYLIAQYRRFGSWELALAAYNAGPNAVAKYRGIPPYKETQAYVRNVMATANTARGGNNNLVVLSSGMDRAGAKTSSAVIDFVGQVARVYGRQLTIGTGTNHNQFVKGTNRQSDHWTGDAADIPMSGAALTRLGQAALIAAGADPKWARRQRGGVFNINGYNILFNTNVGGNHYNHLHVGLGRRPGSRRSQV